MGDKITIDKETFKALAVDTRVTILKNLDEHKATLSDLAEDLKLSPSTVKEHLDRLVAADLIEQIDSGTKWKYYRLTRKGRSVVNPVETKVWFLLAVTAVVWAAGMVRMYNKLSTLLEDFLSMPLTAAKAPQAARALGDAAEAGTAKVMAVSSNATEVAASAQPVVEHAGPFVRDVVASVPYADIVLALSLTLVLGLCIGYILRSRRYI